MADGRRIRRPFHLILAMTIAYFEGIDYQSMGVSLPKIVPFLGLTMSQAGLAASASLIGLTLGAYIGGRASDVVGRRLVRKRSIYPTLT
jgi:MFS family permease